MIKTNLPLGMAQDQRPDGTTRLTVFVDIVFDTDGMLKVLQLMADVAELAKDLCKHPRWKWAGGRRICSDCEKELPGRQSPAFDDDGKSVGDNDVQIAFPFPSPPSPTECSHPQWEWRPSRHRKGPWESEMQRYCSICKADLPPEAKMVKQHNPYVFSCGEVGCLQCRHEVG